jgi:hypothetical protein
MEHMNRPSQGFPDRNHSDQRGEIRVGLDMMVWKERGNRHPSSTVTLKRVLGGFSL